MTDDYTYTDLALEKKEARTTVTHRYGFEVAETDVSGEISYTLGISGLKIYSERKKALAIKLISEILTSFFPDGFISSVAPVTVVCLGNAAVTADSLGPACAKRIISTRLLRDYNPGLFEKLGGREIAVISPGVAGESGISAAEMTKACMKFLSPGLVILIDSLRAFGTDRLSSVVQIKSGGLVPGSGTAFRQPEISREQLGVPVISIGVPTVASSHALVCDALFKAGITEIPPKLLKQSASAVPFLVSSSSCADAITNHAFYIASAINRIFLGINGIC